jgi:hypothetical protein
MVDIKWRENYVDARLASEKGWRDVYRYSPDGVLIGWRRFQSEGIAEFNAEGLMVLEKDSQGRCLRARVVQYETEPRGSSKRVKMVPTETTRSYEYSGPGDWKGHIKQTGTR